MKRWKGSAAISRDDFFGNDLEAFADDRLGLGEGDAEALVGVGPGFGEAEEEVVTGDDEDFAVFEALVEFGGGDGAVFEPEPEEEGAFAGVEGEFCAGAAHTAHILRSANRDMRGNLNR